MGAYPDKALGVLRSVALRMEEWLRQEKFGGVLLPQIGSTPDGRVSEEVCADVFRLTATPSWHFFSFFAVLLLYPCAHRQLQAELCS
jgi:hypothetical protein